MDELEGDLDAEGVRDDASCEEGVEETRARGGRRKGRVRPMLGIAEEVPTGTVSALRERRSGSARYRVEVDGRQVAVVSAEVIGELRLRVGATVDRAMAHRLALATAELAVFDKAIELLAARARSSRDLSLRLQRAGAAESVIGVVLERLERLGLVDDAAYARNLARSRVVSGGVSRRRIAQELQRRGVTRAAADEAISATLEEVELDETGAALAAGEKRLRALRSYDPATQRQRLYAFLARRGYDHDVINVVLKALLS